ncbi:MAG TPA: SPFH domain-containing protein [Anaerolineae bacterium]|nr:SPFH domain-containing protein [Anaerolineae bacterium]
MIFLAVSVVIFVILATIGISLFLSKKIQVVSEDSIAVTVNRDGFIKRVLPAGRHMLHPFEKVDFALETKTRLTFNQAAAIATGDGIPVNINWSGTYALKPELITENISQRLRGLPYAEKTIARHADICLRKLVGDYTLPDLFRPVIRERIERQLGQLLSDRLKPQGMVLNGLNLQAIILPQEVAEAFNKAKAIETLDGAIRQVDPTTREVVRGVYQLDEILHWDTYLPTPSRQTMKRLEAVAH